MPLDPTGAVKLVLPVPPVTVLAVRHESVSEGGFFVCTRDEHEPGRPAVKYGRLAVVNPY